MPTVFFPLSRHNRMDTQVGSSPKISLLTALKTGQAEMLLRDKFPIIETCLVPSHGRGPGNCFGSSKAQIPIMRALSLDLKVFHNLHIL